MKVCKASFLVYARLVEAVNMENSHLLHDCTFSTLTSTFEEEGNRYVKCGISSRPVKLRETTEQRNLQRKWNNMVVTKQKQSVRSSVGNFVLLELLVDFVAVFLRFIRARASAKTATHHSSSCLFFIFFFRSL